jgi:uncharacterized FlgJ-related protein
MKKIGFSYLLYITLLWLGMTSQYVVSNEPAQVVKIEINSLDELSEFFDSLNYNSAAWQAGNRKIPRLTFDRVSKTWQKSSKNLPVKKKKEIFFRLMIPLVLIANEGVLKERELVKTLDESHKTLVELAKKYRVSLADQQKISESERKELLEKVDIVPASLALAQAAEESGWATSRFTLEGNAFFGQWDFSGKGMTPKQQRKELGNYGIARFDSPLGSVVGYIDNINISSAYKKFRQQRSELRAKNKPLSGWQLAGALDKYSERGQDYIDGIRHMIDYNTLRYADEVSLDGDLVYALKAMSE